MFMDMGNAARQTLRKCEKDIPENRLFRQCGGQCDDDRQVQDHGQEEEDSDANDAALVAHVGACAIGNWRAVGGNEAQRDAQTQRCVYGRAAHLN